MLNRSIPEIKSCGEAKKYCMINNGCCCCQIKSDSITVDMVQVAVNCNTFNKIYILKDIEYTKQWRNPMTYKLIAHPVNIFHDPDKYPMLTKSNTKNTRKKANKDSIIEQAQALLASLNI